MYINHAGTYSIYKFRMASLGSTVSTRADTAARHTQACRVNYEHLSVITGANEREFLVNKYKYCMHKDELAVSVSKPIFPGDAMSTSQKYPYPSVVTTLGSITNPVKNFIRWSNHISSDPAFADLVTAAVATLTGHDAIAVKNLKEYVPIGYSVGLAFAHAGTGDNIAAVMTGGVLTIPNGHFPMQTGDMVQFYWDFESVMFQPNGARKDDVGLDAFAADRIHPELAEVLSSTNKRQKFQDRRTNGANAETRKINTPMIKPYVRHKGPQAFADNNRVFAKCVSCARPFDMVDIMICRQAM
jgi:hypothetical protein